MLLWSGLRQLRHGVVFALDPPARAVTKLGVELPGLLVSIMMTAHVEG